MRYLLPISLLLLTIVLSLIYWERPVRAKPLIGYNIQLRENTLSSEQIIAMVKKLKEVGCQVVKVWLPVNSLHPSVENGKYVGWDFSFWDSVLEPLARENFLIILDPWLRSLDEFSPPDLTEEMLVVRKGKRIRFASLFHPRVREFVKETYLAIAKHYSQSEIGEKIVGFVLLCEPYFFNLGAIEWSRENHPLPLYLLIDENPAYPQNFHWQVENLAKFVGELRKAIQEVWEVKTMIVLDVMWISWPPEYVMYERLVKEVDEIGIDPYPGSYGNMPWFALEFILKRSLAFGKPVWVTEWGYDATSWMKNKRDIPSVSFAKEFLERCSRKNVKGILYFNFFEPGPGKRIYSVYNPETGDIFPDAIELCKLLREYGGC